MLLRPARATVRGMADHPAHDLTSLHELQRLRDEVQQLRQRLERVESTEDVESTDTADTSRASRRQLLRLAGAATIGAVAAGVGAGRAAADTGYVTGGAVSVGDVVRQQLNGSRPNEHGFVFATHGIPIPSNNSPTPAAVAVGNMDGAVRRGLYVETFSTQSPGIGIHSRAVWTGGATALVAEASGTGVDATADDPTGVGVRGSGGRLGIEGFSDRGLGATFSGRTGALRVDGWEGAAPPDRVGVAVPDRVLETDATGTLWYSVAAGSPGTWRAVAGPSTAGAFHAVDPIRVFDSRAASPSPGPLAAGTTRTISVADGRSLDTGAVSVRDVVPAGATAVAVNLTITETKSSGYLALAPGSATTLGASSINWWADGITIANGLVVKLDGDRKLKVFCAGAATCESHVIVDVQGYWR